METAPLFHDITGGPADGEAHWVHTSDGVRLRVGHWTHDGAKGTILFFAGRNESVEKYGLPAGEMRKRGYAAIGIDWRGQGLADRLLDDDRLGHVQQFADYQTDIAAILAHVEALNLPKPYYLVGHSLGGCIGLEALHRGLDVPAAAFTAPMWGVMMSLPLRGFAWSWASLANLIGIGHGKAPGQRREAYISYTSLEENGLTADPEMYEHVRRQAELHPELTVGSPSNRWVGLALSETRRLAALPSPDYPCVTFLGTDEQTVDPDRIHDRMARWPNGELVILDGARHEVMVEAEHHRTRIFDRLAAHFDAHPGTTNN